MWPVPSSRGSRSADGAAVRANRVGPCNHGGMSGTLAPDRVEEVDVSERVTPDTPWVTVVWDDPINLMSYVVYVFQKLFGYSHEKATKLMLDVHHKGKAAVSSGTRERMEHDVSRLHAAGLWATVQHD